MLKSGFADELRICWLTKREEGLQWSSVIVSVNSVALWGSSLESQMEHNWPKLVL